MMTNGQQYYNRLIEPIERQMMSVIARIVCNRDMAMDVLHDVLATVWTKLAIIDRQKSPHAYILRICITHAYDALREAQCRRHHEAKAMQQRANAVSEKDNDRLDTPALESIYEAIFDLPSHQGKSFLLRAIQDFSFPEIAAVLECSEPTARSHYSKAKAKICSRLIKQGLLKPQGTQKNE
ncbi:MAG: RNA polymerase sigma factor [Sedimentisphaerales bacterium]|nr:RNA polymerase sigma factor [Sedimentisphaerales bacterium]